ncbi:4'-phosphopantetheinyl transferase family protein [Actinoplanes sp. HUAS TT8]|uniref:4'-phosphopantetheinyl transferase family protein n=1 Tax=Actinoplanes sp. HUAS TT8 TaxID=3447453 RepID=UPI003F5284AC
MRTESAVCSFVDVVDGFAPVAIAVREGAWSPDPDLVAPGEHAEAAVMGHSRGEEFRRGRALLRELAREVLGLAPQQIRVLVAGTGAISLAGHDAGVSISHTQVHTAAAVWPAGRVGIDVEPAPAEVSAQLLRRCCGPWADRLAALAPAERSAAFARVWTVQEACVKVTGLGLAGAPWRIPVDPWSTRGRWGAVRWSVHPEWAPAALAVAAQPHDHRSRRPSRSK